MHNFKTTRQNSLYGLLTISIRYHETEYRNQDAYGELVGRDKTNTHLFIRLKDQAVTDLYTLFDCDKIKSDTATWYPHALVL